MALYLFMSLSRRTKLAFCTRQILSIVASIISSDVKARRIAQLQLNAFEAENLRLRDALGEQFRPENIIGNSRVMRELYTKLTQIAESTLGVLLLGEQGTGKELMATAIHYRSERAKKPFVRVNCAALRESLLESELFGHEEGAFTGAIRTRIGRIEEAEGGTLFLDDIGELPTSLQEKLLRLLQHKEFQRIGGTVVQKSTARIICATSRDLELLVREGRFRQDLYSSITTFLVQMPPLRDRRDRCVIARGAFLLLVMRSDRARVSIALVHQLLIC